MPDLPAKGGSIKALRIMDDGMTLEIDNRVVALRAFYVAWRSEPAS